MINHVNNSNQQLQYVLNQQQMLPTLPRVLWLKIFNSVPYFDHNHLNLTCRAFKALSASTCFSAVKKLLETGDLSHLATIIPGHDLYLNSNFDRFATRASKGLAKSKLGKGIIALARSELATHRKVADYLIQHVPLAFDNLSKVYKQPLMAQDQYPLLETLESFDIFISNAKSDGSIDWNELENLISKLYMHCPFLEILRDKDKSQLLQKLSELLANLPEENFSSTPHLAFTQALLKGLNLQKIYQNEIYKKYIPPSKKIALEAVKIRGIFYQALSENQKKDRAITLAAVSADWHAFSYAPDALRDDLEIALTATKGHCDLPALKYVSKEFLKNREHAVKFIELLPESIVKFSKEIQQDPAISLKVCQSWGRKYPILSNNCPYYAFAVDSIDKVFPDFLRKAVKCIKFETLALTDPIFVSLINTSTLFAYFSPEARTNKALMLQLIEKNPEIIRIASDELKDDNELVEAAVLRNPLCFKWASPRLKDDEAFIEKILKSIEGPLLKYDIPLNFASVRLKKNPYFTQVMLNRGIPGEYLFTWEMERDPEFMLELIKQDYKNYSYASLELKNSPTFAYQALSCDPRVFEFLPSDQAVWESWISKESRLATLVFNQGAPNHKHSLDQPDEPEAKDRRLAR